MLILHCCRSFSILSENKTDYATGPNNWLGLQPPPIGGAWAPTNWWGPSLMNREQSPLELHKFLNVLFFVVQVFVLLFIILLFKLETQLVKSGNWGGGNCFLSRSRLILATPLAPTIGWGMGPHQLVGHGPHQLVGAITHEQGAEPTQAAHVFECVVACKLVKLNFWICEHCWFPV